MTSYDDPDLGEVNQWFRSVPMKVRRELARFILDEANTLRDLIKDAARKGQTSNLSESVRVSRGRGTLGLVVQAGGELTTKEVRGGSGVPYDYALGEEFGNSHYEGQPFFFSTARAFLPGFEERRDAMMENLFGNA